VVASAIMATSIGRGAIHVPYTNPA
jgi:hypothetical protein